VHWTNVVFAPEINVCPCGFNIKLVHEPEEVCKGYAGVRDSVLNILTLRGFSIN